MLSYLKYLVGRRIYIISPLKFFYLSYLRGLEYMNSLFKKYVMSDSLDVLDRIKIFIINEDCHHTCLIKHDYLDLILVRKKINH